MSDLDSRDIDRFISAIDRFEEAVSALSGSVGRGGKPKGSTGGKPAGGGKHGNPALNELDARARLMSKMQKDATIDILKNNKAVDENTEAVKDRTKEERKLTEAERKREREMERARDGVKGFTKGLLTGNDDLGGVFKGLSESLTGSSNTYLRAIGGFAFGISTVLSVFDTFSKEAAPLGAFADLGAFKIGSVRQAKVLSGLGDSFIKAISTSQGGFRSFGKTSEEAVDNFSQMARGFRAGSSSMSWAMQRSLGKDFRRYVDQAAVASSEMGLSTEDTADTMAALASQIRLTAKSDIDAQHKLAQQYAETLKSAKDMSIAMGVSAKEILQVMNDFKRSSAGAVETATGGQGGGEVAAAISQMGLNLSKEEQQLVGMLIAQGRGGEAMAYAKDQTTALAISQLDKDTQANKFRNGGQVSDLMKDITASADAYKNLGQTQAQGPVAGNEANALAGGRLFAFGSKLGKSPEEKDADAQARAEMIKNSEAENIKGMEELKASLNWLRASVIGLTTVLVGFGTYLTLAAAGLGGGAGGALSSILKDKLGGFGKGAAGKVAEKAGGGAAGAAGAAAGGDGLAKTLGTLGTGVGEGIGGLLKGLGNGVGAAIGGLLKGLATGLMAFANPQILMGAAILAGSIALIGAGAGVALWALGKGIASFAEGLGTLGAIDGANLIKVGAGLAAVGVGMGIFAVGMVAGTASNIITGIASLFGAKSPLDKIKEFIPFADKISLIGEGIKNFGDGVVALKAGLTDFDGKALDTLQNKLIDFAKAGSSNEVKLTADYLTAIGTALTTIANIGEIKLPDASDMSIPSVPDVGTQQQLPGLGSILTAESLGQLMSYLANIQGELQTISGNTRQDMATAPVRLS